MVRGSYDDLVAVLRIDADAATGAIIDGDLPEPPAAFRPE
jgi:hypothetical protein